MLKMVATNGQQHREVTLVNRSDHVVEGEMVASLVHREGTVDSLDASFCHRRLEPEGGLGARPSNRLPGSAPERPEPGLARSG